jgi:CDGSH-type Zn-finger protein
MRREQACSLLTTGKECHVSTDETTIKATDNGPLIVKGSFSVLDGEGNEYVVERAVVALCRCGHSSNKPFCDGTHARIGFCNRARAATSDDRVPKSA